jgi:hypothetical protein
LNDGETARRRGACLRRAKWAKQSRPERVAMPAIAVAAQGNQRIGITAYIAATDMRTRGAAGANRWMRSDRPLMHRIVRQ